jgi:hypothetical protein
LWIQDVARGLVVGVTAADQVVLTEPVRFHWYQAKLELPQLQEDEVASELPALVVEVEAEALLSAVMSLVVGHRDHGLTPNGDLRVDVVGGEELGEPSRTVEGLDRT